MKCKKYNQKVIFLEKVQASSASCLTSINIALGIDENITDTVLEDKTDCKNGKKNLASQRYRKETEIIKELALINSFKHIYFYYV